MKKLIFFLILLVVGELFLFFLPNDGYKVEAQYCICGDETCDFDNCGETCQGCPDDCCPDNNCDGDGQCDWPDEDCQNCTDCGSCGYDCGSYDCDPTAGECLVDLRCDSPTCGGGTGCWYDCSPCGGGNGGGACDSAADCYAMGYICSCPYDDPPMDCTVACGPNNACYSDCQPGTGGSAPPGSSVPLPSCAPLTAPGNLLCSCDSDLNITIDWDSVTGSQKYPLRIDGETPSWTGICPVTDSPLGDYCNDNIYMTYFSGVGQAGHSYHAWVHSYNINCLPNDWGPASSCSFTCPNPATILGRVWEDKATDIYWLRGSSSNCSTSPCPGGSCQAMTNLQVTCSGQNSVWTCNGGGAFYTSPTFSAGETVTCTVSGLPTGYECINPSSCSQTLTVAGGLNHRWFEVGCPLPAVPSNVNVTGTTCGNFQVSWSDNSDDEAGFRIVRDYFYNVVYDTGGPLSGTGTRTVSLACPDANSHSYNVYAYKTCGVSEYTAWSAATDSYTCTASSPSIPTRNAVASACSLNATLTWNSVSSWGCNLAGNNNQYFIFVRANGGSYNYNDPECVVNEGGTLSCNVSLPTSGTYYWKVRASNNGSNFSSSSTYRDSTEGSFVRGDSAPSTPTLSWPTNGLEPNINDINLQWNDVSSWGCNLAGNNNRFLVYLDPANPPTTQVCNVDENTTSCINSSTSDLEWGTTYWWRVRATNGAQTADSAIWSFTPSPGGWWQSVGGSVYAAGSVISDIPNTALNPYLLLNGDGVHGTLFYGSSFDLGSDVPFGSCGNEVCHIAEDSSDWYVNTTYSAETYNYNWWVEFLRDEDVLDFNGNLAGQSGVKNLVGGNISGDVGTNSLVVLSSGDINITGEISVAEGGFLMVVSGGSITIDSSIGENAGGASLTGTTANIQGIFIANEIDIGDSDLHLWVGGSFVGWNGINLRRDFDGPENATEPAFTIIFRPDFIINAPDSVKRIYYPNWVRVPG